MSDDISAQRAEAENARVLSPVAAAGIRGQLQRVAASPLAEAQQRFNGAILGLVDAISTRSDLTHVQPLVPETLELLARHAGFSAVEIRFLNEPPPHDDRRISEQLFAPLDYALIAHK